MNFFKKSLFFIFIFFLLEFLSNKKISASPSATYKINIACRDSSDAQFVGKEYGLLGGDPWINYFCIDPTTKSIVKRSYINGKLGEPTLLGKLNNPKGGQHFSTYQWVIDEYVIENSGVNQILVRYGCFSEDFFNCTSSAQRFVIGRKNQGFTKKFQKNKSKVLFNKSDGDEINNLANQIYLSNQCKSALNYKIKMQTMMNNVGFYQSSDSYYDRNC